MPNNAFSTTTTRCRRFAGFAIACALLLAAPGVSAQDDKEEVSVEATEVKQEARPKLESQTAPQNLYVVEKQLQSVKKIDEGIVRMKRLVDKAAKGNPQRAEFLFNLSELYWEKSKWYEQESFAKQEECFALQDAGQDGKAKACEVSRKAMLDESKRLREESVQIYVDIIKNYPEFKDLDQVYYYLGANLMEIGKRDEALDIFRRLIADYPKSSFVPNVLLAFGDYYFDKDDMESALKAYKRVRQYPKSSVYGYARYKEGWCYFNLEGKEKALDTFLETLKIAKDNPQVSSSSGLVRQTRKDIVLTYSFFGAPDKAIPFFRKISDGDREEWLEMGERLAILYADKGNPTDSTRLFRELIRLNKESVKTITYQREIVRNTTTINSYSKESVEELVRLMKLVQLADQGKFKDLDKEKWTQQKAQTEELIRAWATTYHREAQKTKNADLYAMAYFLYKFYLETFQNTEKEYQMTFFYGELLYKLQKWEEAAGAYERVVEIQPKGEYTNESVHGLVLSYFKIVSISEEQADLNKRNEELLASTEDDGDEEKEKTGPTPPPTPKEIPDVHQRLIRACKLYSELNPDGDRIVDVKYTMARIYYDFNHLDEAIAAFKDIAYSHPDHRLSVIAANLHLDALNILNKFDELHVAVLEYLEKQPIKDEAFIEDLQALNSSIRFKKCDVLQEAEKWKETSTCFVAFYRDFPESDLLDKALYNAALAFERQRELGKAIQVRVFLLKEAPESELAPKTLYMIGGNYHALAVYSEAAKFYELYAENYPKMEDAETALSNAATFRHGLGQLDLAIQNFEKYLELYGARDEKRSAEVYFLIAEIYAQQGNPKKAFDQYNNYIRKMARKGTPDHLLQAHVRVGLHYYEQGGKSNKRKAMAWFKKTLDKFNGYNKSEQEAMRAGRDAAAQAKFMFGEEQFQDMAAITIDSQNEKKLKEILKKKQDLGMEAEKTFKSVIEFNRPDWAIAAFYRIGSGYQDFAENIRNSPIPKRLTYEQKEIYRGILEDAAVKVEENAVEAFKGALLIAREKSWFNEYSKKAEVALAQLRPKEFRKPSELRAQPTHLADGLTRTAFITEVKDDREVENLFGGADTSDVEPSAPTSQR